VASCTNKCKKQAKASEDKRDHGHGAEVPKPQPHPTTVGYLCNDITSLPIAIGDGIFYTAFTRRS
jgi:hypothetical protein